jgi:hypothetical protein
VVVPTERVSVTTDMDSNIVTMISIVEDSMLVIVSVFADKVRVSVKVEPGMSVETTIKLPDNVLKLVRMTGEADSVEVQAAAKTVVVMLLTEAETVLVCVTS